MIKAIETRYKGYRFRSRLEARWAVFFDELGLRWEYEPEGFELGNEVRYLPDFLVMTPQGSTVWYEVKNGIVLHDDKFALFREMLCNTGDQVLRTSLLRGDPMEHLSRKITYDNGLIARTVVCPRCGFINDPESGVLEDGNREDVGIGCFSCDMETPCGGGHPIERGVLGVPYKPHKGLILVYDIEWGAFQHAVYLAAEASRSARFEHGECGAAA